jgi:hypothetical protein
VAGAGDREGKKVKAKNLNREGREDREGKERKGRT